MNSHSFKQEITQVLLVDEQAMVRAGLRLLIDSHAGFAVLSEASNLTEAWGLIDRRLDLALINLNSPEQFEHSQELFRLAQQARVILLLGKADWNVHRHTLGQAIKAGVKGLVFREDAPESFFQALERVRAGGVWLSSPTLAQSLGQLLRDNHTQATDSAALRLQQLTAREREIVALLCEGKRNKQIAARLSISEATVRHYLTAIFGKLGVADRVELAVYACRSGLSPHGQPPGRYGTKSGSAICT